MEQTQTMTPEGQQLRDLVFGAFNGGAPPEFRPCAYFDEALDCIRVMARDCSVSETRISPLLTILEDNYPAPEAGRELYVGFTIKGARHFCQEQGLDLSVPVKLTEILDRILAESSEMAVRLAVQAIARPLVADKEIYEVSLAA